MLNPIAIADLFNLGPGQVLDRRDAANNEVFRVLSIERDCHRVGLVLREIHLMWRECELTDHFTPNIDIDFRMFLAVGHDLDGVSEIADGMVRRNINGQNRALAVGRHIDCRHHAGHRNRLILGFGGKHFELGLGLAQDLYRRGLGLAVRDVIEINLFGLNIDFSNDSHIQL